MDRRSLLKGLLGLGAIAAIKPKKIFVLPPANGWRLNNGVYYREYNSWKYYSSEALQTSRVTLDKTVEEVLKQHEQGKWYSLGEIKNIKLKARSSGFTTYQGFKAYYMGVDTALGKDKIVTQILEA